jgi:hypothetical protein
MRYEGNKGREWFTGRLAESFGGGWALGKVQYAG